MTPEEIRLECLRLSVPRDIANPDIELILTRAKAYETYVAGKGQVQETPNKLSLPTSNKPGQPASQQTRQQR